MEISEKSGKKWGPGVTGKMRFLKKIEGVSETIKITVKSTFFENFTFLRIRAISGHMTRFFVPKRGVVQTGGVGEAGPHNLTLFGVVNKVTE